ncbi:MAG TPA: MinD/ParA family protein [Anaerolineae bacterium]|nr:AAA family ATPase [Anaerolineae bacterium]MCB0182303.1 AAA family ATPase [Anaerolineae bacterium]MCB0222964.1 AAA family ATPase [Anaerolineae bacterium]HRV95029.1 MinD/ParA family protein [Anaerolineae bacterium]
MPKVILFHSFYHGVGRSNIAANMAYLLAKKGKAIGLIDADTDEPVQHCLFGLADEKINYAFNDYLWGDCSIEQAAHPLTIASIPLPGQIHLIPGNRPGHHPPRQLSGVNDAELLHSGYQTLIDNFQLDALFIDTHAGISEKALVPVTVADVLVIILRLNQGDYQGTGVAVEVVRQLDVERLYLIVNEAPLTFDFEEIKTKIETTYRCDVAAILPYLDQMMAMANRDIFAIRYPHHPVTTALDQAASLIVA